MDAEFDRRWRESCPPFDGLTVTLSDYIPLPLFQPALAAVVECLHTYRPDASLFRLSDWHEHDGIVLEAHPVTWEELRSLIASENTLKQHFHLADAYVREGIFPVARDYLLRFYVDVPDGPPIQPDEVPTGMLDITCQRPLALQLEEVIRTVGVSNLETLPPKKFFDERYAG